MSNEADPTSLAITLVDEMVSGSTRYVLVLGHSCSGLDLLVEALRTQLGAHNRLRSEPHRVHLDDDEDGAPQGPPTFAVKSYVHKAAPRSMLEVITPSTLHAACQTAAHSNAEDGGAVVIVNTDLHDVRAMRFVEMWAGYFAQNDVPQKVMSLHASYVAPHTNHAENAQLLASLASLLPADKPVWPRVVCSPYAIWLVPDPRTAGQVCRMGMAMQECVSFAASPVLRHYRSMFVSYEDNDAIPSPSDGRYSISTYVLRAPTDSIDSEKCLFKTRMLLNTHALGRFSFFPTVGSSSTSSAFHYVLRIARSSSSNRFASPDVLFQTLRSIGWTISDPLPSLASCATQLPPLAPHISLRVGSWVRNTSSGLLGSVVGFKRAAIPVHGLQDVEWPIVRYDANDGAEVLELPQQGRMTSHVTGANITYVNLPLRSCFALTPKCVATCDGSPTDHPRATSPSGATTATTATAARTTVGCSTLLRGQNTPLMPLAVKLGMFVRQPSLLRYALRYSQRRFILHEACSVSSLRENLATLTQHWLK